MDEVSFNGPVPGETTVSVCNRRALLFVDQCMQIHTGMSYMLRLLVLVGAFFLAWQVQAQPKFTINGRLKIDGGDLDGARMVVYKNGVKERVTNSGMNKFSLELELNANYVLSFEKDGFVSKKLSFNTKVPAEAAVKMFTPFDFAVSLFKQYDDLNMVVFNQPVGIIRYEPGMGDFDYDTDYTKSIQAQLQKAMADVERKQKEESQNASADSKRKAAEEKALAKAQAEAEKQAIADARAKAEAQKLAEAEALVKAQAEEKAALARVEAEKKAASAKAEQEKAVALAEKEQQMAQAAREAQEKKKEEALAITSAQPKADPAQPLVQKPKATAPASPRPGAKPFTPSRTQVEPRLAEAKVVAETRRAIEPEVKQESSTMRNAETRSGIEDKPVANGPEIWTDRNEELIVEPTKVMTVVQLTTGDVVTEYRKVIHKWGSTFYFKNGVACSQLVYEKEAMSESLAGATPRGKY